MLYTIYSLPPSYDRLHPSFFSTNRFLRLLFNSVFFFFFHGKEHHHIPLYLDIHDQQATPTADLPHSTDRIYFFGPCTFSAKTWVVPKFVVLNLVAFTIIMGCLVAVEFFYQMIFLISCCCVFFMESWVRYGGGMHGFDISC